MNEKAAALQERTRKFAASVIRFCERLAATDAARRIAEQLMDSANSTDSNYRAACRGRSRDEFIAKLGVAIEEADESHGWLLLLVESEIVTRADASELTQEADELTRIFVQSRKTAEQGRLREQQFKQQLSNKRTQSNRGSRS